MLSKLNELDLPDCALNWIISHLTGRTQVVKCNASISLPASINTSIVQGSGIGPMLYAIMESDLHTVSLMNMLIKYARRDDGSDTEMSKHSRKVVRSFITLCRGRDKQSQ